MPKTSSDHGNEPRRIALNGATMGTRWSALFHAAPDFNPEPLRTALQAAVDEVDAQMSLWRPGSDLLRINAAPPGAWLAVTRARSLRIARAVLLLLVLIATAYAVVSNWRDVSATVTHLS